ncbi:MAG: hypothetical protein ABIK43_04485, partial [candidate division WOR-3 bacterium]
MRTLLVDFRLAGILSALRSRVRLALRSSALSLRLERRRRDPACSSVDTLELSLARLLRKELTAGLLPPPRTANIITTSTIAATIP